MNGTNACWSYDKSDKLDAESVRDHKVILILTQNEGRYNQGRIFESSDEHENNWANDARVNYENLNVHPLFKHTLLVIHCFPVSARPEYPFLADNREQPDPGEQIYGLVDFKLAS